MLYCEWAVLRTNVYISEESGIIIIIIIIIIIQIDFTTSMDMKSYFSY